MASRSIFRMAAESAYSGIRAKLVDGAPELVRPPTARYKLLPSALSCMPLGEWLRSERGRPRTKSVFTQLEPFQVRREMMPEFVSRLLSPTPPFSPPPMRGSLEEA